jgi:hypothetical protein
METNKTPPKLAKSLQSLCSKVALERTRPAAWIDAKAMRSTARGMLESGQSESEVAEWLAGELAGALATQSATFKRGLV